MPPPRSLLKRDIDGLLPGPPRSAQREGAGDPSPIARHRPFVSKDDTVLPAQESQGKTPQIATYGNAAGPGYCHRSQSVAQTALLHCHRSNFVAFFPGIPARCFCSSLGQIVKECLLHSEREMSDHAPEAGRRRSPLSTMRKRCSLPRRPEAVRNAGRGRSWLRCACCYRPRSGSS